MKKLVSRRNVLEEAGVLLVSTILVLTAVVIVPMTVAQTPEHDVGVSNIIAPFSGCLTTYPVNVTVRNYGKHTEFIDVQFEIIKPGTEEISKVEDFSTWPLADWTCSGYVSSPTDNAGGNSPEAYYGYYSYINNGDIMTPTIDASGCCKIILEFNLSGYFSTYYDPNLYVTWTNDGGANWHDITPWKNPISGNLEPKRYSIDICCGCGGCGNNFQVRWYFDNNYYYLQYGSGIYLDDVAIKGYASCAEYAELAEDVEVPKDGEVVVNFSYWTPSGCGEYCATVFTILDGDEDSSNDCKTIDITMCGFTSEDIINMMSELFDYFETFKPDDPPYGWYNPPHNKLKTAKDKIESYLSNDPPGPASQKNIAITKLGDFIGDVDDLLDSDLISYDEWFNLTTAANQIIWLLTYCF